MTLGYQVVDLSVVACDGKHATADVSVWCGHPQNGEMVTIRLHFTADHAARFATVLPVPESGLGMDVAADKEVLDEIWEAVRAQRDYLRDKN